MTESDADFRERILASFDGWGAACTLVIESRGVRLDELAAHYKVPPRRSITIVPVPCGGTIGSSRWSLICDGSSCMRRCHHCKTMGEGLQDIGLAIGGYGDEWTAQLAWNLTMGSLLTSAKEGP